MSRLRYGPKFSQHGAGGPVKCYDDKQHDEATKRIYCALANRPLYKRELAYHKSGQGAKKALAKRAPGPEREEAELRMAEAVRKAVEILEFHMDDLIQYDRKVSTRPSACNQRHIHNVIHELRHKCGVAFVNSPPQYERKLGEDQRRRDEKEILDDTRAEQEQQRLARLRNNREIAERFAAKHNNGL